MGSAFLASRYSFDSNEHGGNVFRPFVALLLSLGNGRRNIRRGFVALPVRRQQMYSMLYTRSFSLHSTQCCIEFALTLHSPAGCFVAAQRQLVIAHVAARASDRQYSSFLGCFVTLCYKAGNTEGKAEQNPLLCLGPLGFFGTPTTCCLLHPGERRMAATAPLFSARPSHSRDSAANLPHQHLIAFYTFAATQYFLYCLTACCPLLLAACLSACSDHH